MRRNIELYIGNQLVEFEKQPDILYNYQENDLTNPTVVKNSFSKTITIDGTPNNNKLFGEIWNVERISGDGSQEGVSFNASKKIGFQLFVDGDIYESGYAKLDNVSVKRNILQYSLSLFGGLGDFFYNLSTNKDGDQLKLSDLNYGTDLDFTINIDTVKEAWDNIDDPDYPKWNTINFAPAYNGTPDDFDTDKVLINTSGTTLTKTYRDNDGNYFTTKEGFVLAELPDEMSEWEIHDLRSYNQRPVIRMKSIIEACCKPTVNGGYDVELDPDFFNNNNSYWTDTWLTLPLISKLNNTNTEQIMTGSTLTIGSTTGPDDGGNYYAPVTFSLGTFSPEMNSLSLRTKIAVGYGNYFYSSHIWFWNWNGDSSHPNYTLFGSLFVQLLAFNGDTVVGASQAYNLTSPIRHNGNLYYGHNGRYSRKFDSLGQPIYDTLGLFYSSGFRNEQGNEVEFVFNINNISAPVTDLKLRYFWGCNDKKESKYSPSTVFTTAYDDGWITHSISSTGIDDSEMNASVLSSNIRAIIGDSIGHTGTYIDQNLLLNTDKSPCDYLLSYCKLFGLYFTKDIYEPKIYIQTRKTFYQRDNLIDLTNLIDYGKEIKTVPITFDTKWYEFDVEKDESDFANRYSLTYGKSYGSKLVDTGYEFNSEKKNLYKDICIRGGIEGLEKSKYFSAFASDNSVRPWFGYGMVYNLFNGENTYEVKGTTVNAGQIKQLNERQGMKYYDLFPKVQFKNKDKSGQNGNNVLVFYCGQKPVVSGRTNPLSYYLTDDNGYMTSMNDGTPCWLFTPYEHDSKGMRLGYKLNEIPVFARYKTQNDSGTITQSLDFGAPRELYTPYYSYDQAKTIYDSFWASYVSDLYDADNKVLTCYVKLEEKPNPSWLRRFYWFQNSIWRLNKISDWNVSTLDTTKMEFVKVLDVNNYTSNTPTPAGSLSFTLSKYQANYTGDTITGYITVDSGVAWNLYYSDELTVSRTSGIGSGQVTITVPRLTSSEPITYTLTARADVGVTVSIQQSSEGTITVRQFGQYSNTNVPASGGTCLLTVISTYPWTATCDRSYVQLNPTSGTSGNTTVQAVWEPSDSLGQRSAICTFTDSFGNQAVWRKSQDMIVELHYQATGETKSVSYQSGYQMIVPSWVTWVDNGNDTYNFTAQNNTGPERSYTATIVGQTTIINMIQEAKQEFSVIPLSLYFPSSGATNTITVTNPDNHEIGVVGYPSWLSFVITDTGYEVTVEENSLLEIRTGTFVIYNYTTSKTYPVTCLQAQGESSEPYIILSTNSVTVEPDQTITNVGLSTNVSSLSITPIPHSTWVYGAIIPHHTTKYLGIITEPNTGATRTETVTVSGSGVTASVVVTQLETGPAPTPSLSIIPTSVSVDTSGDTETISLTYENRGTDTVTATPSDAHVTVGDITWSGESGSVNVTVAPNTATTTYNGYVDFVGNGVSARLTISQSGEPEHYINISTNELDFPSIGETQTITITSDIDWDIEVN